RPQACHMTLTHDQHIGFISSGGTMIALKRLSFAFVSLAILLVATRLALADDFTREQVLNSRCVRFL
ncbi:MAG TPA: hypothetical protein VLU47_03160, partial [Blastocatellia bacterium]|nr:hypothetical protein [Blastocatellia bacterium]